MAGRNGRSVYDMITNGWRRNTTKATPHGGININVPADFCEQHDIEPGDEVAIKEKDEKDGVLEYHFKS